MRWGALAFGLGAYAAALAALAPATLIDGRLAQASGGRLRLAEAQGSLWSGAGWIEVRDVHGKAGVAKPLAWQLLPAPLLHGRLAAKVDLERGAKPFQVTLSFSRLEIVEAGIDLPVTALALGMPGLTPFRLTGEVLVEIPHLSLERGRVSGDATLQWRAAGSGLTPISPLGDYEVRFKAVGPEVHAALRTLHGPLQLEGKGSWSNGGRASYSATARVPAQHQEQLSPLLRLIAIERGAGSFELSSSNTALRR